MGFYFFRPDEVPTAVPQPSPGSWVYSKLPGMGEIIHFERGFPDFPFEILMKWWLIAVNGHTDWDWIFSSWDQFLCWWGWEHKCVCVCALLALAEIGWCSQSRSHFQGASNHKPTSRFGLPVWDIDTMVASLRVFVTIFTAVQMRVWFNPHVPFVVIETTNHQQILISSLLLFSHVQMQKAHIPAVPIAIPTSNDWIAGI